MRVVERVEDLERKRGRGDCIDIAWADSPSDAERIVRERVARGEHEGADFMTCRWMTEQEYAVHLRERGLPGVRDD